MSSDGPPEGASPRPVAAGAGCRPASEEDWCGNGLRGTPETKASGRPLERTSAAFGMKDVGTEERSHSQVTNTVRVTKREGTGRASASAVLPDHPPNASDPLLDGQ